MPHGVATIIIDNDRALLLKRSPNKKYSPGVWGLPGGVVEKGEGDKQAAIRETKEETGLDVILENDYFYEYIYEGENFSIFVFKTDKYTGDIILSEEHTEYKWVDKKTYEEMKLSQSTLPILDNYFN